MVKVNRPYLSPQIMEAAAAATTFLLLGCERGEEQLKKTSAGSKDGGARARGGGAGLPFY
jgi:hypothetical protein